MLLDVRISKNLRPLGPVTKQLRMSGLKDENSNVNTDAGFSFRLGSAPNVGGCDELGRHGLWLIEWGFCGLCHPACAYGLLVNISGVWREGQKWESEVAFLSRSDSPFMHA